MSALARIAAAPLALFESRAVATKELLQVSNRARFHAEVAVVVALVAVLWILSAVWTMSADMDFQTMATVGRASFLALSIAACMALSLISLAASSAIVISEVTGKRLDLLRVTSLSLETVTLGKGVGVMARAMAALLLLTPILAAAQLVGGVTASDVLKAATIILANILVFTSIGLVASAGSRLAIFVVLRVGVFLSAWLVASFAATLVWHFSVLPFFSAAPANLPSYYEIAVQSLLPWGVWRAMGASILTWPSVAAYVAVQVLTGLVFLRAAPRALSRTVRRMDRRTEKLKVKAAVAVKELSFAKNVSTRGRRRIATWWTNLPGSLVGCQLLQSNLFVATLPVALVMGMAPVYLGNLAGDTRFGAGDSAAMAAAVLSVVVSAAVGIEACCMIAREKARRTAEVLATTPAGGPGMVMWKGEALFGTQAFGILAALAFMGLYFVSAEAITWHWAVTAAAFVSFVVLIYAIGVSFSLASRSPLIAVGGAAGVIFLSRPLGQYVQRAVLGSNYYYYHSVAASYYYEQVSEGTIAFFHFLAVSIFCVSLALLMLRNLFARFAWLALFVSLALALMAADAITGTEPTGLASAPYMSMLLNIRTGAIVGRVAAAAGLQTLIAAAALIGIPIGFDRAFLARAGVGG